MFEEACHAGVRDAVCRRGRRRLAMCRPVTFIGLDHAVAHADDARGHARDFLFMRHNDDRDALRVEALQQREDLRLALAVEIAGRLVGKNQMWPVDQGARYRYTLLLATGQLVRPMAGAIA